MTARRREANGATMFDGPINGLIPGRRLLAMLVIAVPLLATPVRAQQVVVIVNGEPITALDIEQRTKLNQMSSQTHKAPPRQEIIDQLIDEKLKVKEARKFGLEISDTEVDGAFGTMASRMRMTTDQLTQQLARGGVTPGTLKSRIRADMIWPQLVRGRYQASLQIGEKDLLTATDAKADDVGYDYTLRPVLFIVPPGSAETFIDGRKREAEALRGRFQGCDEGISFARALKDVAVRDQVTRSSADIGAEQRKLLDSIEVGKLTAPEVTKFGVEMFAVCAKKQSSADNTPGRRKARETIMAERYELRSKQYLREVRRGAMIEYK
jgi:peptidyl-prolyl cis-trans isomerase SurA